MDWSSSLTCTLASTCHGKGPIIPMTKYDFNVLERRAQELISIGRMRDALRIFFYMADGDPSLDAGYLGSRIAECYEMLGELYAAKYSIGELPRKVVTHGRKQREPAEGWRNTVTIDDLVSSPSST